MGIGMIVGSAGSGKTTRLMSIVKQIIKDGVDITDIGYASFTKTAVKVASERAAEAAGVEPEQLTRGGWFKTIHAIGFNAIRQERKLNVVGDPTEDNDKAAKWFSEHMRDWDGRPGVWAMTTWSRARNRLISLDEALCDMQADAARIMDFRHKLPDDSYVYEWVNHYEQVKRLSNFVDFDDLCLEFVGGQYDEGKLILGGRMPPAPNVRFWFIDEAQDCSPLLHAVCDRLRETSQHIYYAGDPWQSIYSFMGAKPELFLGLAKDASKHENMPQSWRCPRSIHALGEEILRSSPTYYDRGCKPMDEMGSIRVVQENQQATDHVNPGESWLVLAATEALAESLGVELNERKVPWVWISGKASKWAAHKRLQAARAFYELENGSPIFMDDLACIISYIPAKGNLETGLKTGTFGKLDERFPLGTYFMAEDPGDIPGCAWIGHAGLLQPAVDAIVSGAWREWNYPVAEMADAYVACGAIQKNGQYELANAARVGTIHSAKGDEADNVLLLNSMSYPARRQIAEGRFAQEQLEEQRRLWYVGVTRAKETLTVVEGEFPFRELCDALDAVEIWSRLLPDGSARAQATDDATAIG